MLLLGDLEKFAKDHVAERPLLEGLFIISEESEYAKFIKDVGNHGDLMSLVVVLPTYDSRLEDEDSRDMGNNLYFMIVKNTDKTAGHEAKFEIFKKTQLEIKALLVKIIELHKNFGENCLFRNIDLQTFRVDPVANYHGTNGWELEFSTETKL